MADQEQLRTTFERNAKALSLRPSVGQGTAITTVRLRDGVACEIEDGNWKLTADMGEKAGGTDTGPNPGVLGRASLGSCMTIAYALWAAKRGVPLTSLEVEIHADYDARGYHGVDAVEPGYVEVRYVVTVESDAPEAEVMAMLDEADAHCDFLFVWATPQKLTREVRVVSPTS